MSNDRSFLKRISHQAMIEHKLLPDFSPEVLKELKNMETITIITAKLNKFVKSSCKKVLVTLISSEVKPL